MRSMHISALIGGVWLFSLFGQLVLDVHPVWKIRFEGLGASSEPCASAHFPVSRQTSHAGLARLRCSPRRIGGNLLMNTRGS